MAALPNINADTITQAVIARHAHASDARLREVMTSLVQHLHAFAREVRLTDAELQAGLRFLAESAQVQGRQELALLSDTLGLSMLVAALNERHPRGCTEATLKQPMQREPAPLREAGAWLVPARKGTTLFVSGVVKSFGGAPLAGAEVEVAQGAAAARYTADRCGAYHFRTALAEPQQLPDDGPVGRLLGALGRETWRPAHLHFQVQAPGHRALVTHVFRDGSPHLDTDAAFAVRRSLVARWDEHAPGRAPDGSTMRESYYTLVFDFVLQPHEAQQTEPRAA